MTEPLVLDDLKTLAGRLLYRQLPEEYRYQDRPQPGELGDLEAYLHGFGHMLDLIRGTIEQAYADAFADPADNGRSIQSWLLPYLAELVGAELLAPDPKQRDDELSNAVGWYKSKGTLLGVDSIADVVSGAETVVVEGWRRVLLTPRLGLPPFTAPAAAAGDGDPLGPPAAPLGTPDLRRCNRAVIDADGASPLYRLALPRRDADWRVIAPEVIFWRARARTGAPCFPGAYDDTSVRTPDLRDPGLGMVGPHPRRVMIHVRPPAGFFEPGLKRVTLAGANPLGLIADPEQTQSFGPAEILAALGQPLDPAPDRIEIEGALAIPADARVELTGAVFRGPITVAPGARLRLVRSTAASVTLGPMEEIPSLRAQDCLLGSIQALGGFAELVYCTVMGDVVLERLWASDCIFAGAINGISCTGEDSCVRYSRVADLAQLAGCMSEKSPANTTADPNFIRLYFRDGADCVLRPAAFGEPGCGVLDLTTSPLIREGAEDEGEMGAYHHRFHSVQLRALRRKLRNSLPVGQEIAIRYDPHLVPAPARVA
jgi:hypothetical protein